MISHFPVFLLVDSVYQLNSKKKKKKKNQALPWAILSGGWPRQPIRLVLKTSAWFSEKTSIKSYISILTNF